MVEFSAWPCCLTALRLDIHFLLMHCYELACYVLGLLLCFACHFFIYLVSTFMVVNYKFTDVIPMQDLGAVMNLGWLPPGLMMLIRIDLAGFFRYLICLSAVLLLSSVMIFLLAI